ncbi:MAG: S66 peptidase family protein [Candidatus Micrarchaeia archaeon]
MHESIVKPPALKQGDTIKIIAPSSVTAALSNLPKAVNFLTKNGFKVSLSSSMHKMSATRYFSAGDHVRLMEIEEAFKDDKVDAILALRGGAGAVDLLNKIDYEVIKDHPKVFIGYSDLTFLQMAFMRKANLLTFQGPMLVDLAEEDQEVLKYNWSTMIDIVQKKEAVVLKNPMDSKWSKTITEGKAKGRLVGGNLSILALLANTAYMPNTEGSILFMEDVDIEPWQIDNMLTSLVIKGIFRKANGLLFGEFPHYGVEEFMGDSAASYLINDLLIEGYVESIIADIIYDIVTKRIREMPSFMDFVCCHGKYITTLPIGAKVEIDANNRELTMLESAVE